MPGKTTELMQLLKTGNSDAARKMIAKMKKSGKKKQLAKDLIIPDEAAHGQTVMHYCAAQNFVEFIHDLGDMGAPIDNLDDRGFTPMHLASGSGRTSAVVALLTRGADPNVASHNGDTPLHLACSGGHASTVEALIGESANATGFNVSGHTPLDLAAQHGHTNAVSVLLKSGQFSQSYLQRSDIPHTALLLAAKSGHNEVIGLLVKHGFDVNRKLPGANGNSFHEAALYGKVETVKYLLMLGADVQAVNHQGLTALDVVNMYTDPRSAGLMKQVLQDAMAQKARARIAQQAPPTQQQQQQYQRQTSQETHYQQPNSRPQSRQQQSGYPAQQTPGQQSGYPQQPRAPQPGQQQSGYPAQQARQQQSGQEQSGYQPLANYPAGRQPQVQPGQSPTPGFSYIMPGMIKTKNRSDSEPVERTNAVNQQQAGYSQAQQRPASGTPQTGYGQAQPMKQRTQSVQSQMSHEQQRQQYAGQHVYSQPSHPGQPQYTQQQAAAYSQQQQAAYAQQQQQAAAYAQQQQQAAAYAQQQQAAAYAQQQQVAYNQQHSQQGQYNQQLLQRLQPQAQQQAPVPPEQPLSDAGPMDLASQIKAKLATRKPMSTSPTNKDPPQGEDPYKQRSNTVSSNSSMNEIRQAVLKRRGSLTERSSASPDRESYDRSNPPTLPRRGHAGPPTFTPLPPPEQEDPAKLVATLEKPKRKPTPKPLPPAEPEMDNELLKKLMRRQDRIQKAAETGEDPLASESTEELPKPPASKPPPPPERKTPALSSETKEATPPPPATKPPPTQPPAQPPSQPVEPPKEEAAEPPKPKSKPKAKPPPPKPKKEEPEVPPWQLELQKRKEKRAVEAIETAQASMVEDSKQEDSQTPATQTQTVSETTPKEVTPPPPEKREATPPPPVKQKPTVSPKKVDSKPPIPPPTVEPREATPPPAPVSQPPPTTAPPPASQGLPPPPQSLPMTSHALSSISSSGQPGTPSSEMSRSTSLSSLPTTASASPLQITEPVAISDWLISYKLSDYINTFAEAGYDTTDFLMGITTDELTEIGVQKPGHKKKIMTALSTVHHKEHLLLEKPASVAAWLGILGLMEYEEVLIDAGYDDIDFISDITSEELQDIGITKKGHLKRFMRGIAELVEVSKSAPPTPSPIPRANGHPYQNQDSVPSHLENQDPIPPHIEDSKTPEPQDDEKTIIAPPTGFDEPDIKRNSKNLLPVANKPKRISQDEAGIMDAGRHRTHSSEREGSVPGEGGPGGMNKMRQLLEQQMGNNKSTESLEMSAGSEASDHGAKTSRSPSHSPRILRKKKAAPPPAPKRASNTQLSMAASMQSLSSSTSSLNSTSDKRVSGDFQEPRVPPKQRKPESTVEVRRVPVNEPDFADPGLPKSYSVEDITAALDDMVSDDELLNDKGPRSKVVNEPPPARSKVTNEPPPKPAPVKTTSNADLELDALSKALQGFDALPPEEEAEEADQLLADIDDMIANLNSELDFEDLGTDV